MKTMIVLALVATFVAYSEAAVDASCADASTCANTEDCTGEGEAKTCSCKATAFLDSGVCYAKIATTCKVDDDCYGDATCPDADTKVCACPAGQKADDNLEKCSGAAGIVASLMTLLMAFAASRMM